ncbi:ribosomal protein L15 [Fomitiporia mediterranea MF3/22]|uniref:ribosomal protein L15 n=1 Tax=Fomitiporia mediterranea (strain MF3/22) TaxID=694068 RepID=UPI000440965B|nr:ribosomal protein L15 [Fomitiporia mediterranea MF3/22]EJD06110.1 ribosomal protein L15 [Fomitiporia mediterranea MF3/22]
MVLPRFRATSGRIHLFNLSPAHNSQKNQKRVGRGDGSKRGGTSGKGNKGQKARSGNGKPRLGFEGGQTTILKRIPKKGFTNPSEKTWAPINLDRLQHWIDQGRITSTPEKPITARELLLSGCVHNVHDGIKLLGDGAEQLKTPIHIVPSRASQSAIKAVEKLGGTVFCKYYNALSLRDCMKGRTDRLDAAPTRREDIQWYMNWRNRGYLSSPALAKNPLVNSRWKAVAEQLSRYKTEEFEKPRR